MANWPSTLPPFRLPASIQHQDSILRTQMDTGPAKARRRFTAVSQFFTLSMQMTGAEYATLMSFYHSSIEFDMADPVTGSTETFRFLAPPGADVVVGHSDATKRILDVELELERMP